MEIIAETPNEKTIFDSAEELIDYYNREIEKEPRYFDDGDNCLIIDDTEITNKEEWLEWRSTFGNEWLKVRLKYLRDEFVNKSGELYLGIFDETMCEILQSNTIFNIFSLAGIDDEELLYKTTDEYGEVHYVRVVIDILIDDKENPKNKMVKINSIQIDG